MMKDHQREAAQEVSMTQPYRFPRFDCYLEESASFFKIHRNVARFSDVTSRLYVIRIGPLHFSFEIFKTHRGKPLGESKNEIDDETSRGDGSIYRRTL